MSYKDALENRLTHIVMCTKSSGVCVQIPLGGGGGGGGEAGGVRNVPWEEWGGAAY